MLYGTRDSTWKKSRSSRKLSCIISNWRQRSPISERSLISREAAKCYGLKGAFKANILYNTYIRCVGVKIKQCCAKSPRCSFKFHRKKITCEFVAYIAFCSLCLVKTKKNVEMTDSSQGKSEVLRYLPVRLQFLRWRYYFSKAGIILLCLLVRNGKEEDFACEINVEIHVKIEMTL